MIDLTGDDAFYCNVYIHRGPYTTNLVLKGEVLEAAESSSRTAVFP